jgi:PrcB C-terminal
MLLGIFLTFAVQSGPSAIQTVVTDAMSQIEDSKQAVARTPAEFAALWRQHAGATAAPKVDFGSRTVVAVFLGSRNSAGYAVEITGTRQEKGALIVEWRERRPEAGQVAAQVITSPAHIATVPKFAGEIRFEKAAP